jgi:uncharacterized protein YqeY
MRFAFIRISAMYLKDQLSAELTSALKAKDEFTALLVRMLLSGIHNREIEKHGKGAELTEEDVLDVLKKELKKRNESAEAFASAGRSELAQKEKKEAEYIARFLPAQMSDEDLQKTVDEVHALHPDATMKDFGTLVKEVMAKVGGKAEGSRVSEMLKKKMQ